MTRVTDLRTLFVSHHETLSSTPTSVGISKGGKYYAIGDDKGNILVGKSYTKKTFRTHHLKGSVHILVWIRFGISGKPLLVAATKQGDICVWQHNTANFTIRLQAKFDFCINALAFSEHNDYLALSTGVEIHLYSNPLQAGTLPTPSKVWVGRTPPTTGQTFLKYPIATGLHFTAWDQLFVSYTASHCLLGIKEPYRMLMHQPTQLPHLIGHTSLSPSSRFAVSTNLFNGFDIFSLEDWEYTGTNDYLITARGRKWGHQMVPISSAFLNEDLLVTGHKDHAICIFKLGGNGTAQPIVIDLKIDGENLGVQHVAAGFFQENPLIIALGGIGNSGTIFFIEGKSSIFQTKLTLQKSRVLMGAPGPSGLSQRKECAAATKDHAKQEDVSLSEDTGHRRAAAASHATFWLGFSIIVVVVLKIIGEAAWNTISVLPL